MRYRRLLGLALWLCAGCAVAQSVSPVIVQYKGKASGRIALTNNTLTPMAVVLEPRSFSITPDGNGVYRPLDAGIHVQLSAMSCRIDPGQTYYVFYKATADKLPAWFTIYSIFSSLHHNEGLDVRILLPHTVYLYPKKQLSKDANEIVVTEARWDAQSHKVELEIQNHGPDLDRVQEVRIASATKSQISAGFPLLPGGRRHLEVEWKEADPPQHLVFQLEHTTLKQSIGAGGQ